MFRNNPITTRLKISNLTSIVSEEEVKTTQSVYDHGDKAIIALRFVNKNL